MFVNLEINLFNGDKVVTFSEKEDDLSLYPRKTFSEEIAISHFKEFIKRYEKTFFEEKFSYEINKKNKTIKLFYYTQNNNMEYFMKIDW